MPVHKVDTALVIGSALLWAVTAALGWGGHGYVAMFLGLAIIFGYAVQGAARKGQISLRFLAYPLAAWALLWAAAFALARYYADLYAGRTPDFTILGLHPSFSWTVLGYWVGGVLTLNVGFVLFRDHWLTEGEWSDFKRLVAAQDEGEGEP